LVQGIYTRPTLILLIFLVLVFNLLAIRRQPAFEIEDHGLSHVCLEQVPKYAVSSPSSGLLPSFLSLAINFLRPLDSVAGKTAINEPQCLSGPFSRLSYLGTVFCSLHDKSPERLCEAVLDWLER
jgi:hypothetical protein